MSYDNGDVEDEFKARRAKLREVAQATLSQDELKKVLKTTFQGKSINLVYDEKEWTASMDFPAIATDPDNNKLRYTKDATLAVNGSTHMPISAFVNSVNWLIARVGYCRSTDLLAKR